jgi:tetratricopeptide (TPR) repeat protein
MNRGRLATIGTCLLAAATALAAQDAATALARGKVEADLGNHAAAAEAFASVLRSQEATPSQRWEALIRRGVAERESGNSVDAAASFEEAFRSYGRDPEALRFLVQALGGALPGEERWEAIWRQVTLDVDRRDPGHPVARIQWPGVEPVSGPGRGGLVTIDFRDGDLQDAFRLFADMSGMNVVVQPGTQGRLTYRCVDRPWDEALEQILAPNGFVARIQGNVVWIGRPEDLGERRPFAGKAISVKFQDESLAAALQEIASNGAATVDLAPGVVGRVTLELHEVPWDQAFDLLAHANGLTWTRSGDVLRVVPRKR